MTTITLINVPPPHTLCNFKENQDFSVFTLCCFVKHKWVCSCWSAMIERAPYIQSVILFHLVIAIILLSLWILFWMLRIAEINLSKDVIQLSGLNLPNMMHIWGHVRSNDIRAISIKLDKIDFVFRTEIQNNGSKITCSLWQRGGCLSWARWHTIHYDWNV